MKIIWLLSRTPILHYLENHNNITPELLIGQNVTLMDVANNDRPQVFALMWGYWVSDEKNDKDSDMWFDGR
jgi:hypothetical protein